jgi:DNA-directed RNA polymerase subunit M/transcription elongation factor TFIIS
MISLITPELRFNKTISEHKKDRINPESKPVYPLDYDLPFEYCCPNCGYKVSVKNSDLEKHSESQHSNLKDNDRKEIEKFIKSNHLDKLSFIDFECPKCYQPVRILFDFGAGGFFGMTYEIKHVIEINNE